MEKEVFNIKELAWFLNCSVNKIRNMISKKEIPYFRIGVKYFFLKSEIMKWIYNHD